MKKRLLSLLLIITIVFTASVFSFAESISPTTLEAPQNVNVYYDQSIRLRWTVPKSIVHAMENEEWDGELYYCIDWKVDNGPWHFDVPKVNSNTYDLYEDTHVHFFGYLSNITSDDDNVLEAFFVHWSFGYENDEAIDLANKKYTFRMRFAFEPYGSEEGEDFITSPYSNEVSIGGSEMIQPPKTIEAPQNLKAELKYDDNKKPYFALNWTNPDSVSKINEAYPIRVKIDFKVGNGEWYSVINGHDWWGGIPYTTRENFDPIEKDYVDKIEIEKNEYNFRILYVYEPIESPRVASPFSNIVKIGTPAYESASPWAVGELDQAAELGFITDSIKGKMNGPITREEFAEVAVNFYEIVTGKKAEPHPTEKFIDCTNPEVLKARNLGIVYGVGGDKFLPKDYLLRQQMAAMITRTLTACFETITPDFIANDVKGVADFKDQDGFLAYGIEPAKFMAKYKITVGDGKGNFGPNDTCTREQAVMFLLRSYLYKDQFN
ncbi:MAG TPA: S-layer homology domain-containing protein [Clostridiaceae bacterium]|nr:S-layer homology domain-containing protein [Clostridiaceae bacterium]